jgi:hypothetical protein
LTQATALPPKGNYIRCSFLAGSFVPKALLILAILFLRDNFLLPSSV